MKRRLFLLLATLSLLSIIVPFFALQVRGETNAGPDQTVYVDDLVNFNGSTNENITTIVDITWDFGDASQPVNGSDPNLLDTTTHTYNETGVYAVVLSVKYNSELNKTETDTLTVTVVENVPPIADAGPDRTVEQTSPEGAEVTLDGSGSSDQYDDPLTYNWTWPGGSALGINPTVMILPGVTNITLMVDDGKFNSTDTISITVVDITPPEINVSVESDMIWPPNHKYVEVETLVTVHDAVDSHSNETLTLVSVTCNEPDNGKGDGNTNDDIEILNTTMFKLRAERSGRGQGRIYTITYGATDAAGNYAEVSTIIMVPHNK